MRLDRGWIQSAIPHQGAMCLLDEVVSWDDVRITCMSTGHASLHHPLRSAAGLGIACGIEYAAQTMAVHGALSAGALHASAAARAGGAGASAGAMASPAAGFLVGLRGVEFLALRLDDVPGNLYCDATRVAGNAATALYDFAVRAGGGDLLRGRATVVLDAKDWMRT